MRDVLNLSDETNELLVMAMRATSWTGAFAGPCRPTSGNGPSTIDGETYQLFTAGHATLLVDTDMGVNV